MAATNTSRRPAKNPSRGSQIRRAFRVLLDDQTPGEAGAACNPLSVITPGGRCQLVREFAAWAAACGRRVIVRDGRELGREIAAAMAADSWDRLRGRFAGAELVVVEQLEKLGNSRRLTAFRHLYDAATAAGTRFCISLAAHPLSGSFDPDLAGRLAGGLLVSLRSDDPEVAEAVGSSSCDTAQSPVAATHPIPSLARVLSVTARHYGLSVEVLIGPGRSRTVSHARSLAMYLARRLTQRSFATIGRACGGRDHTTALHGSRVTATRIAADPVLAADVATILALLEKPLRSADRTRVVSVQCQ